MGKILCMQVKQSLGKESMSCIILKDTGDAQVSQAQAQDDQTNLSCQGP